ncbi:MAG: DUF4173 domain-containing protein [Notoacmeibacter sp.]|nr:DUF4173 domain-containing protein [Notoacmeibacter sp.]
MKPFPVRGSMPAATAATIALVALADFSLDGRLGGFGVAVPLAASFAVALLLHRKSGFRPVAVAATAGAFATAAISENLSLLSFGIALCLASLCVVALSGYKPAGAVPLLGRFLLTSLLAPFSLGLDMLRFRRLSRRRKQAIGRAGRWAVWLMPVSAALVFLLLFIAANPVLDQWLAQLDLQRILDIVDFERLLLWAFLAVLIWPLVRSRLPLRLRATSRFPDAPIPDLARQAETGSMDALFGEASILRALILFNLLFALQTAMDMAYLWGGVALPDGMSYAGYAHRGAYPLIVTALLAAGFVLAATRPGTAPATNGMILGLIGLWVLQNIGLVLSSILRLDLYVSVYGLTYWRVAAFIWMGLIASGLALILIRIATGRSIDWLVGANLATLSAVLLASCFVNFAGLIADNNADSALSGRRQGSLLDTGYMAGLGPQALPAMARLLDDCRRAEGAPKLGLRQCTNLNRATISLVAYHAQDMQNWRGRSLRGLRLDAWLGDNQQLTKTMPQYPDGQTSGEREP